VTLLTEASHHLGHAKHLPSRLKSSALFTLLTRRHLSTFFCALTANPGTLLAVDVHKNFAFLCTGITNLGTKATQRFCEIAVPRHVLYNLKTDFGTVI
jgi:hypothetical protein